MRQSRLKLPKNWKQVTLMQLIQLLEIEETESIDNFVSKISILTGKDFQWLKDNIRVKDIDKINKRLSFLNELPKPQKTKWFIWKWKFYKHLPYEQTTTMQVADIMNLNQNETNEAVKVLNVLSAIFYTNNDKEYNAERFKKMQKLFEKLPVTTGISASFFFSNGLTHCLKDVSLQSLKVKDTMTLTQMTKLKKLQHLEVEKIKKGKKSDVFINGTTSLSDLQKEMYSNLKEQAK